MEDYQPAMAATLAAALATPETPHPWNFGFAVQEIKEHVGKTIDLHVEGKAELCELRRNSTETLDILPQSPWRNCTRAEMPARLSSKLLDRMLCVVCQRYRKPNQPAPESLADFGHFNQKVQSDVFWIKDGKVFRMDLDLHGPDGLRTALTYAKTDQRLSRGLLRHYADDNISLTVG
eukprot:s219_g38.t1